MLGVTEAVTTLPGQRGVYIVAGPGGTAAPPRTAAPPATLAKTA